MTRLDRYLAWQFARIFSMCVAVFVGLFLLITLFERLETFLRHKAAATDCALYLFAQVPWMLVQVMPTACLLATLISLTIMSRAGETTALRATGLSLMRIARPFLLCGAVVCGLTFLMQETVIPKSAALSHKLLRVNIRGHDANYLTQSNDVWMRYGDNWIFVKLALPSAGELRGVDVLEKRDGEVVRQLKAKKAVWKNDSWVLHGVTELLYEEEGGWTENSYKTRVASTQAPPPTELTYDQRRRATESLAGLKRRIDSYRAQGLGTKKLKVQWWSLTSMPFACVLMPLLAVPFGLRSSRKGGMWASIGVGVGVSFLYLLILMLGTALGQGGYLPPSLAAWSGNIIFLAIAVKLLARAERGS